MTYYLDLGDGGPLIPCRDPHQALWLARVWVALYVAQSTAPSWPAHNCAKQKNHDQRDS